MSQPTPLPSYDSYVSGSVADEQPHRPHVGGTHGLATASLVLGICGAVPLVNLLAMVFGVIALLQLRDVNQKGRGLAIGGICAAGCWILLYVVIAITLAIRTE